MKIYELFPYFCDRKNIDSIKKDFKMNIIKIEIILYHLFPYFYNLKSAWACLRGRMVIFNAHFKGPINIIPSSRGGYISNNIVEG